MSIISSRGGSGSSVMMHSLFHAVTKGDARQVGELLRLGADANCKDEANFGLTPLIRAAWADNVEVVQLLLDSGARVGEREQQTGATALHIAAQQNCAGVTKKLIDAQADVDALDSNRQTPLMACAALNHIDIGSMLLRAGADTDMQQRKGFTALHFCCEHNHVDFARLLVQYDAKLDISTLPEADNHSPFTLAALHGGRLELMRLLSNAGADIHHKCAAGDALQLATRIGDTATADFLQKLFSQRHHEVSQMSIPRQAAEDSDESTETSDSDSTETSESEEVAEAAAAAAATNRDDSSLKHSQSIAQLRLAAGKPNSGIHRTQSDRQLVQQQQQQQQQRMQRPQQQQQQQQQQRRQMPQQQQQQQQIPHVRKPRQQQQQQQVQRCATPDRNAAAAAALAPAAANPERLSPRPSAMRQQQQQQQQQLQKPQTGHRRQGSSPQPPAEEEEQQLSRRLAKERLQPQQQQQQQRRRPQSAPNEAEGISCNFKSWKIKRNDKPIGAGSFGIVYKAFTDRNQFVAVKVVKVANSASAQQLKQAIRNEEKGVRLLARLNHRNILKFLKTDRDHLGNFCIFTELLSGNSLAGILDEYGTFSDDGIVNFTRQICTALDYIHNCDPPVLHRDLKCSNVMLTNEGVIKLIDFGLAKEILTSIAYNPTGIVGTPCFIAPEILDGRHFTDKSDIWSLGCTVFEMATASPPNADKLSVNAVMFAICNKPMPKLPPRFSPSLQQFYSLCVQKQPRQRPNAADLLLHPLLTGRVSTAV